MRAVSITNAKDLIAITCAAADGTLHGDVSKKLHVNLKRASPLTVFALALLAVEAEVSWPKVSSASLDGVGKDLTDRIKCFDEGDRCAPWTSADGRLIDEHAVIDLT